MFEDKRIYFRISFLFFIELEMMNVVVFKLVIMSFESNFFVYFLYYVVDDKVVKIIWVQECVYIKGEFILWVIIDLEVIFDVEYVIFFNRIDEYGKKWDLFIKYFIYVCMCLCVDYIL